MTAALRTWYDEFIRTFGNVLFAVSLFLVWGVLTLIGVVVDQGKDAPVYFQSYAPPIARAILRLGFDNIYHSPWYVGIIALILTSLVVCTFARVIPARMPVLRPVKIDKMPLHATVTMRADEASLRQRVDAFFRSRGWQLRAREFDGTQWSFADKHNWARRGVLIAHIGFVIIAAGTTIYWARGFASETVVVTGQNAEIPETHAILHLDSFAYKIQPIMTKSGMVYQPIDYVSQLHATGSDGMTRSYTLRVNHPIDIDGTLYYQSSYGFAMRFDVLHNGTRVAALSDRVLREGDSFTIPGTQKTVTYGRFVPTVDRSTGMPAADPRVTNPAVIIDVTDAGNDLGSALVMMRTWVDVGDGWRIVPAQQLLYSGIQYRYDPGIPLVGVGALVLLAGLIISFYFLPARLFVNVVARDHGTCDIGIAATTVKGYDIYAVEFRELIEALKSNLEPPSGPHARFVPAEA